MFQILPRYSPKTPSAGWRKIGKEFPHGDTLNYVFKKISPTEVQEVVCLLVERLIRKKILYAYRLYGNFQVAVDGTGILTFHQRHCEHCLTRKLNNGETLYYHPVLEAKLVCANGFVFSLMTEFVENTSPQDSKQDCELKAFYRLSQRLKARSPFCQFACYWTVSLLADQPFKLFTITTGVA